MYICKTWILIKFLCVQENLSVLDFVDKSISDITPVKPHPLDSTPFILVEDVKDLKQLAAKLKIADEFAVNFWTWYFFSYLLAMKDVVSDLNDKLFFTLLWIQIQFWLLK